MLCSERNLARRMETAEAHAAAEYVRTLARLRPESGAAVLSLAGGAAVYAGPGSPITQAIGLGLDGPVSESDFDRLESFFRTRDCRPEIEVCPLADPSLLDLLGRRGYRVLEWSNVLARLIDSRALAPAPRTMLQICRAGPEHAAAWVAIMNRCLLEQEEVTPEARDLLEPSFHVPSSAWFLGIVKGVIAGCAGVFLHGDVAVLAGAATLPAYRGRGIQAALSRARIEHAVSSGCNLAVSITRPGTASQHNAERLGFEIVYTRAKMAPGA